MSLEQDYFNEIEVLIQGLKEIEDEIRQVRQYHEQRLRYHTQSRILAAQALEQLKEAE